MAGSVNKVTLIGNLGKDPEIRTLPSGEKVVNFTLATSETWNDRASGERKERTEWHRIVCFNDRTSDVIEKYVKKGSKVYVEGSLQTRKWTDQSGVEKYTTEIVIGKFKGELTMLDTRGAGEGDSGGGYQPRERAAAPARQPARAPAGGGGGPQWDAPRGGDLDDEIPF